MSRTKWIVLIAVVVLLVIQLFRPHLTNPTVNPQNAIQAAMPVPPDVQSILERSCYNCHSSKTRLPWYSNVAPVSWLLASDINEGREDLSFSEFATYSKAKAARKLQQTCQEVKEGDMPPWYYVPLHPDGRLSPADEQRICAWATAEQQRIAATR
jgi:Haem-binding domain